MTALSELLQDAKRELGLSVDDLINAAEKRTEKPIARTRRATIYKALEGGHAQNPEEGTLQLFADVFQLDIRDVRVASGKPAGELGPWVPVAESARLAQPVRDALDELIKAIARGGGARDGAAPKTPPGSPPALEVVPPPTPPARDFSGVSGVAAEAAREDDEPQPPAEPEYDENQDDGDDEPR